MWTGFARGLQRLAGAMLLPVVLWLSGSAQAQEPSASCATGPQPISLELGQGVPLPRSYGNPTGDRVTFTLTMRGNALFGPAHQIGQQRLDPHTGVTLSAAPIHPTGLRTPTGADRVIIDVTTDRTGNQVVGQCDYIVTLRPPPGVEGKIPRLVPPVTPQQLSWLFQIPVRMCVLEGSELAGTRAAGDTIAGSGLMALLESVNQDIWFPQAQIAFSSVIETGVPVIADPTPPSAIECGRLGDLAVAGFALEDAPDAERACAAAWENRYPGRHGNPVIFARAFCDSGSILGGAPPPDRGLYVAGASPLTGRRGDDLCGVPKHLTQDDIINESRSPFVVLVEPARLNADTARNNLAHELGHNLFLGHGNGFDDNMDGMPAGRAGPKRYDEYCDPAWLRPPDNEVLVEDEPTPFTNCEDSSSLMNMHGTCQNLQPLQIETARGVARLFPGFKDNTPVLVVDPQ